MNIWRKLDGFYGSVFFLFFSLILHVKVLELLPVENIIYGTATFAEMFHQFKGQVLIVFVLLLGFSIAIGFFVGDGKKKFDKFLMGCLGIYGVSILLSYAFASDKALAWRGALDHYEGAPVLIAYLFLCLFFYWTTTEDRAKKWLLCCFAVNNGIMALVGISQMMGKNILNHPLIFNAIIWPANSTAVSGAVGNNALRAAYGTVGNQNFMGSYLALSIPLLFFGFMEAEKRWKPAYGVVLFLSYLTLLGSSSRAGLVGVCVSLPIIHGYYAYKTESLRRVFMNFIVALAGLLGYYGIIRSIKTMDVLLFIIALTVSLVVYLAIRGLLAAGRRLEMKKLITVYLVGIAVIAVIGLSAFLMTAQKTTWVVSDLKITENRANLTVRNNRVIITAVDDTVEILNQSTGESIFLEPGNDHGQLKLSEGSPISFNIVADKQKENLYALLLYNPNLVFAFGNLADGNALTLIGNGGLPIEAANADRIEILDGLEKVGNTRTYIWSRTVPMIMSHFAVGVGPDNFVKEFPQNDVLGKLVAYGTPRMVVDKPHNWFMQIAANTGVIGVIAVLALLLGMGRRVLAIGVENKPAMLIVPLFTALVGYTAASLFNDSVISVAPLFWAMVGITFALIPVSMAESAKPPKTKNQHKPSKR